MGQEAIFRSQGLVWPLHRRGGDDQRLFDILFAGARKHTAAVSQATHALPFESILLAMLLEQAREIERLKSLLDE